MAAIAIVLALASVSIGLLSLAVVPLALVYWLVRATYASANVATAPMPEVIARAMPELPATNDTAPETATGAMSDATDAAIDAAIDDAFDAATTAPLDVGAVAGGPYRSVQLARKLPPDATRVRAAAARAFERWVRELPRGPRRSADLIRSIELRSHHVGRLITEIETRRVEECYEPAPNQPALAARVLRQQVDPWNPPDDLRGASHFITACWSCEATGVIDCALCGASGRVRCASCDGSGKHDRSGDSGCVRLICATCHGRGQIACARCSRGKFGCPTCERAKKLAGRLEIRSESRREVKLLPDVPDQLAFGWRHPGLPASDEQVAGDAIALDVISRSRALAAEDLPRSVPASWRIEHAAQLQIRVGAGERILSQSLTLFAIPSASVTYAVCGETRTVSLEGLRMVAPPARAHADELFLRRARQLDRMAIYLGALPIVTAAGYLARSEHFTEDRALVAVIGVMCSAAAFAALAYGAIWTASLGRQSARRWAHAAIVAALLAAVCAVVAEPRLPRELRSEATPKPALTSGERPPRAPGSSAAPPPSYRRGAC